MISGDLFRRNDVSEKCVFCKGYLCTNRGRPMFHIIYRTDKWKKIGMGIGYLRFQIDVVPIMDANRYLCLFG